MGFLSSLLGGPSITREDLTFGRIRYFKGRDGGSGYWEGEVRLSGVANLVQVIIEEGEAGPTAKSVDYLARFEREYPNLIVKVRPVLASALREWLTAFDVHEFSDQFTLESFDVPREGDNSREWELAFSSPLDEEHLLKVPMLGWEVAGEISFDG